MLWPFFRSLFACIVFGCTKGGGCKLRRCPTRRFPLATLYPSSLHVPLSSLSLPLRRQVSNYHSPSPSPSPVTTVLLAPVMGLCFLTAVGGSLVSVSWQCSACPRRTWTTSSPCAMSAPRLLSRFVFLTVPVPLPLVSLMTERCCKRQRERGWLRCCQRSRRLEH